MIDGLALAGLDLRSFYSITTLGWFKIKKIWAQICQNFTEDKRRFSRTFFIALEKALGPLIPGSTPNPLKSQHDF